jgi:uncharacterized protein YkwD
VATPAAGTQPAAPSTQPSTQPTAQDEPAEPELRAPWRYWLHRRADAWHRGQKTVYDPAEAENMRLVNQYRELLGFPPVEGEPHLTQAARAHAKEMFEMKYVSHTAMNKEAREPAQRAQRAGFTNAEAVVEVIASGAASADAAFLAIFNSAEDHRTMVNPNYTVVGVGKWQDKWVQVYATAERMLLASEQARLTASGSSGTVQPQSVIRAAAAAEAAAKRAAEKPPKEPRQPRSR